MNSNKDVEAENQREIYLYPGSKSKSRVWRYFGFYRKAAGLPTKNTYSQHFFFTRAICRRRFERTPSRPFCFRSSTDLLCKRCDVMLHIWEFTTCTLDEKFYLHLYAFRDFLVHFMAEVRLYSQWQIISFFSQISVQKFPIPKIRNTLSNKGF